MTRFKYAIISYVTRKLPAPRSFIHLELFQRDLGMTQELVQPEQVPMMDKYLYVRLLLWNRAELNKIMFILINSVMKMNNNLYM